MLVGPGLVAGLSSGRVAAASSAVSWAVDPAAKTISVTVSLGVFVTPPPENDFQRRVVNDALARIKTSIERLWNGRQFKCYALKVKVNVRAATGRQDIQPNEVAVELDRAIYPVGEPVELRVGPGRSITKLTADEGETYLSDDPHLEPVAGATDHPSRWSLLATDGTFAHEFGHVLGLDDNYVDGQQTPRQGAAKDMMFHQHLPLSDETIVKAIRRSGQVDESKIKCPLKLDMAKTTFGLPGFASVDFEVHGCAPDYTPASTDASRPAGAHFQGTLTGNGEYIFLGGGGGTVTFDTVWTQQQPAIEIALNGGALVQAVAATGSGPTSISSATLQTSGGTVALGESFVIIPFDGPCP